jgi:hypothetical protein
MRPVFRLPAVMGHGQNNDFIRQYAKTGLNVAPSQSTAPEATRSNQGTPVSGQGNSGAIPHIEQGFGGRESQTLSLPSPH